MQKGKTVTFLVLALEIASIATLHVVKISQTEKTAAKQAVRNGASEVSDTHPKTFFLAAFK